MNSTKSGNSTISESLHAAKGLGITLVVLGHIKISDQAPSRRIGVLEAPWHV